MKLVRRFLNSFLLGLVLVMAMPSAVAADDKPKRNQSEEIQKKYYKKWMEEDVFYLITESEKDVFQKLTTDEERDQFIEQFWRRRDPDPKTTDNEYKEEHYRRLSYTNEYFTSGIPGWKTDRGMVYIKFGPPDHIEDYVYGAAYDRPAWEGLGKTKVFPTQFWEYRFIEGIGPDVEFEFVDSGGGNLYTLTADANKKDLLLHADTQGRTMAEQMGKADIFDRVTNRRNAGDRIDPYTHEREKDRPFSKYELLASVSKPPEIKYKDLKSIVDTRVTYDLFPFEARLDYIKISEQQVLVPLTIRIKNSHIEFKEKGFGVARGQVNVYGIVTTLSGNFVQEFEDDIVRDFKAANLEAARGEYSVYQKFLLLASSSYKLGLVLKDTESGKIGMSELRLGVPRFEAELLNASSMILTRQITKVDDPDSDIGPFVLGDIKVIPDFEKKYLNSDPLWVYLQIYNLSIDQNLLRPEVKVDYIVERDGNEYYKYQDLKGSTFRFVSGDRLVITGKLPIKRFAPGLYTLRVRVQDAISGQTLERTEKFEIGA